MIPLLDTNVIIRFLTADKNQKYKDLYGFFESLEQGQMRVELKLIVLFQVVFVLKSFYGIPREDLANGLLDLLEYKGIAIKERKVVRRTIELWRDNKLDIVDCYLIGSLAADSEGILYSYDRDFDKFGINRKEP